MSHPNAFVQKRFAAVLITGVGDLVLDISSTSEKLITIVLINMSKS